MDNKICINYEKDSALIRYASLLFNNKKLRNNYASKLVKTANELKYYAYPIVLINSLTDSSISNSLNTSLTPNNSEKLVLEMNQQDSHFIDSIGVSDIDKNIQNIFEAYNNFYKCGNFDKLNRACYRFLKRIKGANEYEMNDNAIRYMVSCICMNDYNNCINIIESIGNEYVLFDYNIYLFLLYFVQGKYEEASEKILHIQSNVSEDFYSYVSEKDLAFYFSFCLLINFNSSSYKQVLSNNNTLVYKLYDKYNEYFKIVDEYYKCDYLTVNSEFNKKLKDRISEDPFLSGFSSEIESKFKKKILKEILSFASEIDFETIQNLLILKSINDAKDMVIDLIKKEKIPAIIDDIEGIVIIEEKKPIDEILEKINKVLKNNLNDLIKYSLSKDLKHKFKSSDFSGQLVEKKQLVQEGGAGYIDMALGHRMGIPFEMMGII